ncbi:MAG: gamma-glutamyl-gamma-aminobutyrate hydrolase family protein [Patescibacteria group bacterium]|nr:gamma-glutamyl-gamma-aminobutyrate hydrolase family protein [Patescibacteria group bacterium]
MKKNILLIQFRQDISASHEKDCFLHYFSKKLNLKLKIVNAFDEKVDFSSPKKLIKNTQGVILGGSGEFYLSGNPKEKEKILQKMLKRISFFIEYLFRNDFPTLGVCFGHQLLGYFLGGEIINDKNQSQKGSFLVSLTKEGKNDPLFSTMPQKFFAQFGHRDSLKNLPKKVKLLAKTKKCKIVAFKYKNKIWGVQFHPELDYKDMLFRFKLYSEYLPKKFEVMKKKLKPSPFSSKVIQNFLKITNAN